MSEHLRIPGATYRLQFNKGFGFRDAADLIAYLHNLGITDIYASPLLKARSGSMHGYDVTDTTRLNPELGSEQDFDTMVNLLHRQGMGLLLDIAPNHMAADPENPWWISALSKGEDSRFRNVFDFDWLDFDDSWEESAGYRRFFDIDHLVGVRVEDLEVFKLTHFFIFQLIADNQVTGLRIDHIDGLYDPLVYLKRIQRKVSGKDNPPEYFILVEKILSGKETISESWPVFGTTGYEFLRTLNNFFVDSKHLEQIRSDYVQASGLSASFKDIVYEKKRQVMLKLFPDEISALSRHMSHVTEHLTREKAERALIEITACLPVYRTYTRNMVVNMTDRGYIEAAVGEAGRRNAELSLALNDLRRVLLLDFPADFTEDEKSSWLDFVMRWQQLTGAIMAKGFEDTALYNYNCLISLNEVGGTPDTPGITIPGFHDWNMARLERKPHTMNSTSTHDTKRSEDVRARINVLSELPDEWRRFLHTWMTMNKSKKQRIAGRVYPDANTEILLYQTMIGAWPLLDSEIEEFKKRLRDYMIKAVREAKTFTRWREINNVYEDNLLAFIDNVLASSCTGGFIENFHRFQQKIAWYGALNSLSQLLLKVTLPGFPDFYQGTELWDFNLVDPDNRRPVDYEKRKKMLDGLVSGNGKKRRQMKEMLSSWRDGRIKMFLMYESLNVRRNLNSLFKNGTYLPLEITGPKKDHVFAFIRTDENDHIIVAISRHFSSLAEPEIPPVGKKFWSANSIQLPDTAPKKWANVLDGEQVRVNIQLSGLDTADIFQSLPMALLVSC